MTEISGAAAQAREAARQGNGQFGEQPKADPGGEVVTSTWPGGDRGRQFGGEAADQTQRALEPVPLTVDDRIFLADWRGAFRDGYDESDIARFAAGISSVRIGCLWEYHDEWGYGGDSELFGAGPDGLCRPLSSEAWQYLFEDDPDTGESNIPSSLVRDEPAWFQLDASLVNATHEQIER